LRLSSLKVRETAFKTLLLTKENTYRRDKNRNTVCSKQDKAEKKRA